MNQLDTEKKDREKIDFEAKLEEPIKETDAEAGKHGDTREAEHTDYQDPVTDQRVAQMILNKVLDRLKEAYLLQMGSEARRCSHRDVGQRRRPW